jgi:hypothetical protein
MGIHDTYCGCEVELIWFWSGTGESCCERGEAVNLLSAENLLISQEGLCCMPSL